MARAKTNPPIGDSAPPVHQRIVLAARQHFLTHGFRGVTMADLARALGMSKKTLYAHFTGKADLLRAVLLGKFAELEAEFAQITAESPADFPAALTHLLACVQRHTAEIQPPFVRDLRQAPEIFHLAETKRSQLIQRYVGGLFAAGRRANFIRKDIPTKFILEILLGVVQALMNPTKMVDLGLTPKTGFAAIISVILDGVLIKPRKGQP